jgi:hypothetical protein
MNRREFLRFFRGSGKTIPFANCSLETEFWFLDFLVRTFAIKGIGKINLVPIQTRGAARIVARRVVTSFR